MDIYFLSAFFLLLFLFSVESVTPLLILLQNGLCYRSLLDVLNLSLLMIILYVVKKKSILLYPTPKNSLVLYARSHIREVFWSSYEYRVSILIFFFHCFLFYP